MEDVLGTAAITLWSANWNHIVNFKILLLSIVIEALPFLLLSVVVSAFINNFVSENAIHQMIPKNKVLSIFMACFLGILFPVCDCGMVPVVRRLILKGVPLPAGIAFMLAAPIVNPVVGTATAFAFQNNPQLVLLRLGTAFGVALCTGLVLNFFCDGRQLKPLNHVESHGCCLHPPMHHSLNHSQLHKWIGTLRDASHEFFEMGKYLLIGAMLGSLSQILIPREMLLALGQDSSLSTGTMMLFAFFISVCSAADAFIAASFAGSFTLGSLTAFMVFGPMIDLKNLLMLLYTFRTKFVLGLSLLIALLCFGTACLINYF